VRLALSGGLVILACPPESRDGFMPQRVWAPIRGVRARILRQNKLRQNKYRALRYIRTVPRRATAAPMGQQRYFGLKATAAWIAKQGHVHGGASADSVADCHMLPALSHGEERKVWATATIKAVEAIQELLSYLDELQKKKNRGKSSIRAKVEHPCRIPKLVFGFDKVRYVRARPQADSKINAFVDLSREIPCTVQLFYHPENQPPALCFLSHLYLTPMRHLVQSLLGRF